MKRQLVNDIAYLPLARVCCRHGVITFAPQVPVVRRTSSAFAPIHEQSSRKYGLEYGRKRSTEDWVPNRKISPEVLIPLKEILINTLELENAARPDTNALLSRSSRCVGRDWEGRRCQRALASSSSSVHQGTQLCDGTAGLSFPDAAIRIREQNRLTETTCRPGAHWPEELGSGSGRYPERRCACCIPCHSMRTAKG